LFYFYAAGYTTKYLFFYFLLFRDFLPAVVDENMDKGGEAGFVVLNGFQDEGGVESDA
jgi:hypothetical protein